MPLDLEQTIAALASPPGASERGIVRMSGQGVGDIIGQVFVSDGSVTHWRKARTATRFVGSLQIPELVVPLPVALMYWPTARSFTGQPMAEFHLIGSPPILDAVLERICECGARPARRGEFTMRAFLAGRIDLLQAEAVLGVIDATDQQELGQALGQLGGEITAKLKAAQGNLIAVLGDLEAGLDFVDEDIEFITKPQICDRLAIVLAALNQLASDSATRLPAGWRRRVVLAGLPNAGKSTLFNRLAGRKSAIVSPVPGTTRDYLTAMVILGSVEVELVDTAGWEDASDLIMSRAQELRGEQFGSSDLVVWCTSAVLDLSQLKEDARLRKQLADSSLSVLHVITQTDLLLPRDGPFSAASSVGTTTAIPLSAETGTGLSEFTDAVMEQLLANRSARGELLGTTAVRCRDSLRRTIDCVESARTCAIANGGDELISMDLRHALRELAAILGEVYTDDILDHVFSNFCIGK